jgi:hypothetical protein
MELILISNNNISVKDCRNMLHEIMTVKTNPKILNDPNGPSHHQFITMITHNSALSLPLEYHATHRKY